MFSDYCFSQAESDHSSRSRQSAQHAGAWRKGYIMAVLNSTRLYVKFVDEMALEEFLPVPSGFHTLVTFHRPCTFTSPPSEACDGPEQGAHRQIVGVLRRGGLTSDLALEWVHSVCTLR